MEIKHLSHFTPKNFEKSIEMLPNGKTDCSYELTNKNGMQLKVSQYGATITALKFPLSKEKMIDVVLGFDNLESYILSYNLPSPPYFGATVGRFAGRINNSKFELNDETVILNNNYKNHSLHGGNASFSKKIWKVQNLNLNDNPSITLSYFSPDGEENYPGDLIIELTYTLTESNELVVDYKANTTKDTIVNLTHHSYFNLDGHQSNILNQELIVNSQKMLQTTNENIPTGYLNNVANCPFDFRLPKKCPSKIDHTFVIEKTNEFAASLFNPNNNLKMTVFTDQPGVHIYVGGNCFNTLKGKEDANYHSFSGICFETQNYPDAPNHSHFPNAVLKKEDTYTHKTIYKFQLL